MIEKETNTEDIIKRIIKCYLCFQKEATATMIVKHMQEAGYGLRKIPEPAYLTKQIKKWRYINSWFNVYFYKNKMGVTVFYLENVKEKKGEMGNYD